MSSIKAVFMLSVTIAIASAVGAIMIPKPLDVGILESLLRGDMQAAMITRIEISDTLLENADSTIGSELEPPAPLRIVFSYSGAITASYMDYGNGLFNIIKSICKNWHMVRKLKILVELENEEVKGDGVSS